MSKLVIGLIIGFVLGVALTSAVASNISGEALWNKVYDATAKTIAIEGV